MPQGQVTDMLQNHGAGSLIQINHRDRFLIPAATNSSVSRFWVEEK